jgi:hypothetical protein
VISEFELLFGVRRKTEDLSLDERGASMHASSRTSLRVWEGVKTKIDKFVWTACSETADYRR